VSARLVRVLLRLGAALAVLVLGVPAPAGAHGGSYDLKYVDGSNLLLVTFNTHRPVAELAIDHNLRLYDLLGAPVPYDEVEVEFHSRERGKDLAPNGGSLLHAETVPMLATNESRVVWAYPVAGQYTIVLRFLGDGRTVSSGKLAVDVGPPAGAGGFTWGTWLPLGLGVLGGVAAYHVLVVRRRVPVPAAEPARPVPPRAKVKVGA
jgi:hypothetical protein